VVAAIDAGVSRFDSHWLDWGCPFAPCATGNVLTEDLVFKLEAMGLSIGIDIDRPTEVCKIVERELPDEPLHNASAAAGLPKGFAPAGLPV